MEVYLEIEDVKYGRMIAELFENLSEGCLYELLNHKTWIFRTSSDYWQSY